MLFLGGKRDAKPNEAAERQHRTTRHRHTDQSLFLHSLVYLTLE